MHNRVMEIWKEKIWKPYVENTQNSASLLGEMESHKHQNFIDSVQLLGTRVITFQMDLIPFANHASLE